MKRSTLVTYLGIAVLGGVLALPANADIIYNFSANLSSGTATGTLTGTLDLPFVTAGGSGSGAASSLVLTSIPAGFGSLGSFSGGANVTSWADQVSNSFIVISGVITSFDFMAVTNSDPSVGNYFCVNSTSGSGGAIGGWVCPADLNELSETGATFGYNFNGLSGVTFTAATSTPEPATVGTMLLGLTALYLATTRKRTVSKAKTAELR
jgi:hypothetical protein